MLHFPIFLSSSEGQKWGIWRHISSWGLSPALPALVCSHPSGVTHQHILLHVGVTGTTWQGFDGTGSALIKQSRRGRISSGLGSCSATSGAG